MSTGEKSMGNVIEPQQHTTHPAGYNPAFLLPFTLQVSHAHGRQTLLL